MTKAIDASTPTTPNMPDLLLGFLECVTRRFSISPPVTRLQRLYSAVPILDRDCAVIGVWSLGGSATTERSKDRSNARATVWTPYRI